MVLNLMLTRQNTYNITMKNQLLNMFLFITFHMVIGKSTVEDIFDQNIYHKTPFDPNMFYDKSAIINSGDCGPNYEKCLYRKNSYFYTKEDCAMRVFVPIRSGSSDKDHIMEVIIPPGTKIATSKGKYIFRAEQAVIESIQYDDDYYGKSSIERMVSGLYKHKSKKSGKSQLDDNIYHKGTLYKSRYPINLINNVGIFIPLEKLEVFDNERKD